VQAWSTYIVNEANVLLAEGKPAEALSLLDRALPRMRGELGITYLTVKLAVIEAVAAAFELRDTAKLEELLATIEALRPGERPPLLTAHAARFRALLASDPGTAETGFLRATNTFRELDLRFWLAVTQLEHAEWLVEQGRMEEAEPLLAEARETFEHLEAAPWIERAARAVPAGREPEAVAEPV
jgi:hypothetical protein